MKQCSCGRPVVVDLLVQGTIPDGYWLDIGVCAWCYQNTPLADLVQGELMAREERAKEKVGA